MQERRRYERVAFFCAVDLMVLPNGPTIPGRSFDVSLGGVGLTTENTMLERGQAVRVRFHLPNGRKERLDEDVLGRIAYTAADEDGNRMGVEFQEILNASDQPLLIEKLNNL